MSVANSLKSLVAPVALAVAFGVAANDAHALDFGCRDKEQIKKELMAENQVPVVRFYAGDDKEKFSEVFFTMNTQTREGYRMSRTDDKAQMCISGKFTDVRLYNPQILDQRAYLDAADADKKGTGINNLIYGRSQVYGENAMFRASEYSPISKDTRITYIIANPLKGNEGGVLSSTLEGEALRKYSKKIPNAQSGYANVDHGAELTNTGKLLVGTNKDDGKVASLDMK